MSFPVSAYPKQILVRDTIYSVRFVRIVENDPKLAGICDCVDQEIKISIWQTREAILETFIHEVIHAIEFEYEFDLKHKHVYVLGLALALILLGKSAMPRKRTRSKLAAASKGRTKPRRRQSRSARSKALRQSGKG